MKKLFFIILFSAVSLFAQKVYIDTLANGADTLFTKNFWGQYSSAYIGFENLGTGADTLEISNGIFVSESDTSFIKYYVGSVIRLTDASAAPVDLIVIAQGASLLYYVNKGSPYAIRVRLRTLSAGSTAVFIEAIK